MIELLSIPHLMQPADPRRPLPPRNDGSGMNDQRRLSSGGGQYNAHVPSPCNELNRARFVPCGPHMVCLCDIVEPHGVTDSVDFFEFIHRFFAGSMDFNQDGATTTGDFFDFTSCFTEAP